MSPVHRPLYLEQELMRMRSPPQATNEQAAEFWVALAGLEAEKGGHVTTEGRVDVVEGSRIVVWTTMQRRISRLR